jgi:TPR repeat protein
MRATMTALADKTLTGWMEQPCRKALDLPSAAMLMQIPPIAGLICRRRMPPARSQSSNNARPACWPRSPAIEFRCNKRHAEARHAIMTTRSGAVSLACTFGIGVLALTLAAPYSPAQAQSADLVLCDRLAADPSDPDKPAEVKGTPEIDRSDVATAIKFCRVASAASRRALYQLGRAYAANQQMSEAAGAYRRAPDKGSTSAMVELGVLLATGSGVGKDEAQARKLFERAAAGGNPRGATNLAALPNSGGAASDPVKASDPAKARALLAKAAETNSAEAQYQLGLMTADGIGGPQDDVAARALFEKAAAQGHAGALERAGAFAQSGRGGPQDASAAKAYYEKAAALGNEEAKAALKRAECSWVLKDKRGNVVTCF